MSAIGDRIRDMRATAGITQSELAVRSGISQPKLSDYERGVITPNPSSCERILRELRPRPSQLLEKHADEILVLARDHHISRVRVFGSAVHGTDTTTSDVDLLVTFDARASLFDLSGFANAAEDLLGYPVDVVSDAMPPNRIMDRIVAEAVPL